MLPLGRLYEVGGRRLMLHRSGDGGPAVVFLPGAGLVGLDFLNLQERVAGFTTNVLYDRAGTGWSDPAEVAGLLLLDPGHEDILAYMPPEAAQLNEQMKQDPEQMPDLTGDQIELARAQYAQLYKEWPDPVREALAEHHLVSWRSSLYETANFETEIYDELRHGGGLPDVPLLVLTAGGDNPYWAQFASEEFMRQGLDGVRRMQAAIAASVPRGEQRVIEGASHQYMHLEQPDQVLRAVRDLVAGQVPKPCRA